MRKDLKKSVLVNASNLHSGGGIQVATSFIKEALSLDYTDLDLAFVVSSEVFLSLEDSGLDAKQIAKISICDTYGISAYFSGLNTISANYDLIFTIFGPNYLRGNKYIDIVGFAQAWILDDSVYKVLPFIDMVKARLKFFLQRIIFKRSDVFIVELEHVRENLCKQAIGSYQNVYVVHNCISSIFSESYYWQDLEIDESSGSFRVGFLGRDYPHKNTEIIPKVRRLLRESYGLEVEFFVTFNDSEWGGKSDEFKKSVKNVGSLSVGQCPSFYLAMDAIIFPSLLECFSATPIEAMAMERPVFASNKRFVRDVCSGYAFYFDPLDPADAARALAIYIRNQKHNDGLRLAQAKEHAMNFSSPRGRAQKYLEIIRKEISGRSRKK